MNKLVSKSFVYALLLIALNIATIFLEIKLLPIVILLSLIFVKLYNIHDKLEK